MRETESVSARCRIALVGFGTVGSAIAVGAFVMTIAFIGLFTLHETFGVDLDFHESDDEVPPLPKATIAGG